jgi:hypothetical protein
MLSTEMPTSSTAVLWATVSSQQVNKRQQRLVVEKTDPGLEGVAQWYSTHLACTGPGFNPQHQKEENTGLDPMPEYNPSGVPH